MIFKNPYGHGTRSIGYRNKHLKLYGSVWGGLPYPPRTPPLWQNFWTKAKLWLFLISLVFSGQRLPYMIKPSSVTKRNNMEGVVKCMGMVYTPHQCWYSDRKSPYWEKSLKVPKIASGTSLTIPNTLPGWSYQYLTLCTTLRTFFHLPGAKMTILASNSPLGRGRTILHILKWLETHPKVVNALNWIQFHHF